jgi:PAS domain S-box-containing protein/putative nucleotidyltransferase with HDIG domain
MEEHALMAKSTQAPPDCSELTNLQSWLKKVSRQDAGGKETPQSLRAILDELGELMSRIELGEREWRDAFDAVQHPIFIHDRDYRILRANKAYARQAGLRPQEVVGRPYWELFPKADGPLPQCADLMEKQYDDSPYETVTLDSGETYLSRAFAVHDAQGEYLHSVHIMEDITEQRRLQQALEENAERYRSLFESAPDAIFLADAENGQLLDANPAAERLIGRPREEIASLHQSQLHPADAPAVEVFREHVQTGLKGTAAPPTEIPVLRADGSEVLTEISAQVLRLDGKPVIQGVFRDISARKALEAKLHHNAQVLDQIHDSVVATDLDGIVTSWNRGAERLFGYAEAEALGRPISFVYPEDEHAFLAEQVIAPLLTKGNHEVEVRMHRKSGESFFAQLSLSLLHDEQGTPVGMIGYSLDITQRKQTEQALHDSEETFRAISNTAQDAVVLLDDEGRIAYWNPAAECIFGHAAAAAMGQVAYQLLAPPPYHAAWQSAWSQFRKSGKGPPIGKVVELSACHRDGSELPIELSVSSVCIRGQWHAVGILRDVTERRHAEAMLNETGNKLSLSLHLLEDIIESIPIRVFWKDKELRYLGCNTLFAQDAGFSNPKELIGKTDLDMGWQEQARLYQEDDRRVIASGLSRLGYEEPQTTPDGQTLWLRTSKVPLHNDAHETIGVLGIYDDITQYKQMEEDLRLSESRLKEAQEVAHLGSWELDLEKDVLWWSDENHRIFGVEPGGKNTYETFLTTVHPEDRAFVNKAYLGSVEGRTAYDIEHRLLMPDGSVKWVNERCKTYYDDDGIPLRSAGTTLDITERRKADERLRRSEASLVEAQRIAHLGNWDFDLVNDHVSWSDEIFRIFEVDPEKYAASYERFLATVHPDDRERVERSYRESLETKRPYDITHRLLMPDGRIKYVREMCESHYDEEGHPLRSVGTVQDITEQYLTEQALNRSNRALKAISSCNSVLIHDTDEAQLLNNMCRVIIEQGGYRFTWIGLVENGAAKRVRPVAHAGFENGYLDHVNITYDHSKRGRGPVGCAIRRGTFQVVHDTLTDPHFTPWRKAAAERGYRSVLALPLKTNDAKVFAVLGIYAGEANAFDSDALDLMQELADDLAFGILNLRTRAERDHYFHEHRKSDERYKQVLVDTIRAISLTVEKRDPYTAGHQNKVAQLSVAIAREMGLDENRIEGLRLGAMIHDIGKIYVPAEILNRPGRLSAAEFEIIQSHAEVGYDIIKDVRFPWPVADMVIQHHERVDGSGYPRALKGDEILLEARILAVADVVEAITSHRPYRPAVGLDKALLEIETNSGTRYDPEVADVCLCLFRDKHFQFD